MNCPICNQPMRVDIQTSCNPAKRGETYTIYTCETPGSCKGLTGDAAQIAEIASTPRLQAQYQNRYTPDCAMSSRIGDKR